MKNFLVHCTSLALLAFLPLWLNSQPLDSLQFKSVIDSIDALNNAGAYEEALSRSRSLYAQAVAHFGENSEQAAKTCHTIGMGLQRMGEADSAEAMYLKSVSIRIGLFGKDYAELQNNYSALGTICNDRGELQRAIEYFNEALRILKLHFPPGDKNNGRVLNNLAIAYDLYGDYYLALETYTAALNIKLENSFPPLSISNSYSNIGSVWLALRNIEKAIGHFEISQSLLEQNNLLKTQEYATGLMNLGVAWFENKNYPRAKDYFERALELMPRVYPEGHPQVGLLWLNLGNTLQELGDLPRGEQLVEDAMETFRAAFGNDNYYIGACNISLGQLRLKEGSPPASLPYFQKAVDAIKASVGDSHTMATNAMNNLGTSYHRCGRLLEAEEVFKKAVNGYEKKFIDIGQLPTPTLDYLDANVNLANISFEIYKRNGKPTYLQQARTGLGKSLQLFVQMRSGLDNTASKQLLLDLNYNLYAIAIGLERGHDDLIAFQYAEQSKASLLYASMKDRQAKNFSNVPPQLLEKEDYLNTRIAFFRNRINNDIDNLDFANVALWQLKIDSLTMELANLITELEKTNKEYFRIKYDLSTASIKYIQDSLLRPNQTLLEYFTGDSSIFIFTIKKEYYQITEVKNDFPLQAWIKQLQNGLFGYYGKDKSEWTDELYKSTLKDYLEAAPKLYDKLIAPVKDLLTDEVILLPDGVLGYIPFEALLKSKPEKVSDFSSYPFMLNDHRFSYCYSATLLREMKEKQHKQEPSKPLVAFAPFYEGSYAKLEGDFGAGLDTLAATFDLPGFENIVARKEFKLLPNSGEEVFAASKLWDGDYFINEQATEGRFDSIAGDYRIVHLSTHGIADPRIGDYSYLAFAEQKDSIENEYLYVRDLYNLQLNADLVVLSACETAAGELQRGEGIISLARAFAYAGAKSILTTLWVVDDAASKELTKEFYLQLKKGKTKDEALHLAKKRHLKVNGNNRKHPFFWAAMIPVGDMSALK